MSEEEFFDGLEADSDRAREIWAEKAAANVETWGTQDLDTLVLAATEELGELSQARLEARDEDGDPERIREEIDDLGALLLQLRYRYRTELAVDE